MSINVFQDLSLVRTNQGQLSVEAFLARAADPNLILDLIMPGYEFGATWRLLAATVAVAIQIDPKIPHRVADGDAQPISQDVIAEVLNRLAPGLDLQEGDYPFFQRPVLPPLGPKDTTRHVGPGKNPAWKLSPTVPGEYSQTYWDLQRLKPETLDGVDGALALMVFATYFPSGNSRYDGSKCLNGSPGFRYLGDGNTATEFLIHSRSPLESLLKSIPRDWVRQSGLPAWADRTGEKSRLSGGEIHPLWSATWSSNTAACAWEGNTLVGVRIGGIPENWFLPEMGTTSEERKQWWDTRNARDPFYFYLPDSHGSLKARRLDLSRDLTELAVEWAHEDLSNSLRNTFGDTVLSPDFSKDSLLFIRHQIAGTSHSPIIRESVITQPDTQRWVFDVDARLQERIRLQADFILTLYSIVMGPFRPRRKYDKAKKHDQFNKGSDKPGYPHLFSAESRMNQVFWRMITPVYEDFIDYFASSLNSAEGESETGRQRSRRARKDLLSLRGDAIKAAQRAFDSVIGPYLTQNPSRNFEVQQRIHYLLQCQHVPNQESEPR
ncbi:type I-E CRISPR-associated protein Cse1/CasA [Corynebacterium sp. 3HC-13]|nr:type I-E CRISPR-associated protein Cse1/CasA [Corynebacterium poyangense]